MSKITGKHLLHTNRIHLSNGDSMHIQDFSSYGGVVLKDGTAVLPELQRFINTDYYKTPVEVCLPEVLYTDNLEILIMTPPNRISEVEGV